MEILPHSLQIKAANLPLEKLAANPHLSEADKGAEVSRQFEAVLLRQILTQAQKNSYPTPDPSCSLSKDIYQDMVTHQLAEAMSKAGTFGLAQSFQHQLTRQLQTSSNPADQPSAPLAGREGGKTS